MKELSLEKMEEVQGGGAAGMVLACAGGAAMTAVSAAATCISGGAFGWLIPLAMVYTAASCYDAANSLAG